MLATLVGVVAGTALVMGQSQGYRMTVSQDRLINAQNEPQNWLLMNGDYGNTRYSKLAQINRENVKNLRMVWALALGGMQDVGQNGPEAEVNPLVDNGVMYTTDGWGTVYKIDASAPDQGKFLWTADAAVRHAGNQPRTRGIALWEDHVIANLPDGRVIAINRDDGEIVWDKRVATRNEFGGQEEFFTAPIVADGIVLVQNGAGDGGTRGWIAGLDVKTGDEKWRFYTVPKPGEPGSETWKDDHSAWKTGGGGIWQTGAYDPATHLYIVGTGNPYPIYDPQFRPGDNLYTNSVIAVDVRTGKLAWHFQYTPNDSWDFDEVGVHMLYDIRIDNVLRKVVGHYARNGFYYTLDRTNGKFIRSEKYVNDSELDEGDRSEDRQAVRVRPEEGRADLQPRGARAAGRRPEASPVRRGTAASRTSRSRTTRPSRSRTVSAPKAASRRTARWSPHSDLTEASTRRRANRASTAATCTTVLSPRSTRRTTR
ncbi:MAG: PQQ-binding-like beta-propeller repeat protein [Vicinamibacterales bacterium]